MQQAQAPIAAVQTTPKVAGSVPPGQLAPGGGAPSGGPTSAPQAVPGSCVIPVGTYRQLKAQQDELLSQRQILANRRETIGSEYERGTGANKDGLGQRISILDKSIVQMETQIACLAQGMALKAPDAGSQAGRHWNDSQVAGLGFTVLVGTIVLMNAFWRRIGPRRWSRVTQAQSAPQSNERLDRIEQAVDTIAVEIERISENQRFMTRLMTETQLAGTIAQVRSSAEAAKSEVG